METMCSITSYNLGEKGLKQGAFTDNMMADFVAQSQISSENVSAKKALFLKPNFRDFKKKRRKKLRL